MPLVLLILQSRLASQCKWGMALLLCLTLVVPPILIIFSQLLHRNWYSPQPQKGESPHQCPRSLSSDRVGGEFILGGLNCPNIDRIKDVFDKISKTLCQGQKYGSEENSWFDFFYFVNSFAAVVHWSSSSSPSSLSSSNLHLHLHAALLARGGG